MKLAKMLNLSSLGNFGSVNAGSLERLPADGKVGLLLTVHTVGNNPFEVKSVAAELTDATEPGIVHPRRFVALDVKGLFPELFRPLPKLRPVYFETLPPASGGYAVQSDGIFARYLPGRNVVICTTRETGIKAVLQMSDWQRLLCRLLALRLEVAMASERYGEAGARSAGVMADDFLRGFVVAV